MTYIVFLIMMIVIGSLYNRFNLSKIWEYIQSYIRPGIVQHEPDKAIDNKKIIVKYKGSQYDITKFVKYHPGGKDFLIDNNGLDIEKQMLEKEHSAKAYKILEKYKIN